MRLTDFLIDPRRFALDGDVEVDALRTPGAMAECGLFDVRFDAVRSVAWVLIDLRGSFYTVGNTAVIVVNGVRSLKWINPKPGSVLGDGYWSILVWEPDLDTADGWAVRVGMHPWPDLTIDGTTAEFYVGDVPGGDDPPPMVGFVDARTLADTLQNWNSEFSPSYGTQFP